MIKADWGGPAISHNSTAPSSTAIPSAAKTNAVSVDGTPAATQSSGASVNNTSDAAARFGVNWALSAAVGVLSSLIVAAVTLA
jgi:hypothetical protein